MNKMRNTLRLPLTASALVVAALLTACGDATGPQTNARSGYINASSAVGPSSTKSTPPPTTTVKTDTTRTTNSGYNVTAD